MEFFPRNRRTLEVADREEEQDEMTGEVIESQLSDDGKRLDFTLRMQDGSAEGFAVPTLPLKVRFTSRGLEYPDENN